MNIKSFFLRIFRSRNYRETISMRETSPDVATGLNSEISLNGYSMEVKMHLDDNPVMNIGSENEFPSNVLSNFYPSEFTFDGLTFRSMEGLLQSLKTNDEQLRNQIHNMTGIEAKRAGKALKDTFDGRQLYWKDAVMDRFSSEYYMFLQSAYRAKYEQDPVFRDALEASRGKRLVHTIGKQNKQETILTEGEFISLLEGLREK